MHTEEIRQMVLLAIQAGFIGFIMPKLVGLLNKQVKDADLRAIIAIGVCGLAGLAIAFGNGQVGSDMALIVSGVIVEGQIVYNAYWKPKWDKK